MPLSSPLTLRDLAKALNLSHVTVSFALRDSPRVSAETRARVQAAALRLGYRPNLTAKVLASQRKPSSDDIRAELAWINLWPVPKHIHDYREFHLYWEGARDAAVCAGYRVVEFDLTNHKSLARIQQILVARGVPGILIPPHQIAPDWTGLDWARFSVVKFGHSLPDLQLNTACSDQVGDARLAVEKIQARGYRRVGFVTDTSAATRTRFALGYLQAHMLHGVRPSTPPFVLKCKDEPSEIDRFGAWLRRNRPDAILTDIPGTQDILARQGLKIPGDIALATTSCLDGGFDAGIDQNSREIGHAAVEMLIGLIHHQRRGLEPFPRLVSIQGQWRDGNSLPPRSEALMSFK